MYNNFLSLHFQIFQAVQFLHDLGTIQHFTNDFLKDKVVINPQWIVDVMACVVSVKTQVIKVKFFFYQYRISLVIRQLKLKSSR